eukprot:TRINITY_DN9673_c0_g1_i1.p1 TRINITY_DN9673_c0_g1~~TRINITY_DN9673_c0_g1_i1.p1  ORF type:complete len:216 (-),score=25.87 TRINITY_DN9673_c0_g1_i1:52-699(-)
MKVTTALLFASFLVMVSGFFTLDLPGTDQGNRGLESDNQRSCSQGQRSISPWIVLPGETLSVTPNFRYSDGKKLSVGFNGRSAVVSRNLGRSSGRQPPIFFQIPMDQATGYIQVEYVYADGRLFYQCVDYQHVSSSTDVPPSSTPGSSNPPSSRFGQGIVVGLGIGFAIFSLVLVALAIMVKKEFISISRGKISFQRVSQNDIPGDSLLEEDSNI